MRIHTMLAIDRVARVLLVTTLIRVLVVPAPLTAEAAGVLVAPLAENLLLTERGRVIHTDGPRLATIAGNALISPAMPVTLPSTLPPESVEPATIVRPPAHAPAGMTFRVVVTGYSSTPDQTDASPFTTASGTRVHDGTLAANFLPIGTRVTLPDYSGDKVYTVEDRTNPRYASRADIWFASRAAALTFGKRTLMMTVVE